MIIILVGIIVISVGIVYGLKSKKVRIVVIIFLSALKLSKGGREHEHSNN